MGMRMGRTGRQFVIHGHHRYDLREWLRNEFGFVEKDGKNHYREDDLNYFESRMKEVLDACEKVEETDIRGNSAYIKYYADDWQKIRDMFNQNDTAGMAEALSELLAGIDWE